MKKLLLLIGFIILCGFTTYKTDMVIKRCEISGYRGHDPEWKQKSTIDAYGANEEILVFFGREDHTYFNTKDEAEKALKDLQDRKICPSN